VTLVTKSSLVALDKSHETLVANDEGYWMKEKNQQIQVHPLTPLYNIVTCDYNAIILVTIETNDEFFACFNIELFLK
jgi:hypothetical protein